MCAGMTLHTAMLMCYKRNTMAYNRTQQDRIDQGLCPQCGRIPGGKVYCDDCIKTGNEKRQARLQAKADYLKTHCSQCDRETTVLHPWGKERICFGLPDRCYEMRLRGSYKTAMDDIQTEAGTFTEAIKKP
jgi:hypothetical protein